MIQAVVFDFDGLIVDTESIWFDVYRDLLSADDVDLTLETFCECVGTTNEPLYRFYEQQTGVKLDATRFQQRARSKFDSKMNHPELRPGVLNYLRAAQERGLRIGLASSSHRPWVDRFLHHFDIYDYLEAISTGDQVEQVKPDPALYSKTIEELGVKPRYAVAFEDSVNGCKAALAAGLHCVAVPNLVTSALVFPREVMRIDSMGSVRLDAVIRRIEGNEDNCVGSQC